MALSGVVSTLQTRANEALPSGEQGSRNFIYFYSAPPILHVIIPGGTNQGYKIRAVPFEPSVPVLLGTRLFAPTRPLGLTIEFATDIAGTSVVGVDFVRTRTLATALAGTGSLTAAFVRNVVLGAVVVGQGTVVADQAGGTLAGVLVLTPELTTSLVLTTETGDGLTLTPETPADSLTLTPA
jgi:hypothetical protein